MPIDPQQAARALDDIAGVERRTRQALVYGRAGGILMAWGVLVIAGYLSEHLWPSRAAAIWIAVNAGGLAGTAAFSLIGPRAAADRVGRRLIWGLLVLMAYGLIWSLAIGGFGPRQLAAFWPTVFMCGYVLAGIWLGRGFIVLGVAVTLLTLIGYQWFGPWLALWLAVVNGGGLLLGGVWLRRLG